MHLRPQGSTPLICSAEIHVKARKGTYPAIQLNVRFECYLCMHVLGKDDILNISLDWYFC